MDYIEYKIEPSVDIDSFPAFEKWIKESKNVKHYIDEEEWDNLFREAKRIFGKDSYRVNPRLVALLIKSNIPFLDKLNNTYDCMFESSNITSLEIPDNITQLGSGTIDGCVYLKKVIVGIGVNTIPRQFFFELPNLEEVVIPNTITAIGHSAFEGCKNLKSIKYLGTTDQWEDIDKDDEGPDAYYHKSLKVICSDGEILTWES